MYFTVGGYSYKVYYRQDASMYYLRNGRRVDIKNPDDQRLTPQAIRCSKSRKKSACNSRAACGWSKKSRSCKGRGRVSRRRKSRK